MTVPSSILVEQITKFARSWGFSLHPRHDGGFDIRNKKPTWWGHNLLLRLFRRNVSSRPIGTLIFIEKEKWRIVLHPYHRHNESQVRFLAMMFQSEFRIKCSVNQGFD